MITETQPKEMTRIAAVKMFLGQNVPVESSEMMNFWKSLTTEEKSEFSSYAAKELNVTLKVV